MHPARQVSLRHVGRPKMEEGCKTLALAVTSAGSVCMDALQIDLCFFFKEGRWYYSHIQIVLPRAFQGVLLWFVCFVHQHHHHHYQCHWYHHYHHYQNHHNEPHPHSWHVETTSKKWFQQVCRSIHAPTDAWNSTQIGTRLSFGLGMRH